MWLITLARAMLLLELCNIWIIEVLWSVAGWPFVFSIRVQRWASFSAFTALASFTTREELSANVLCIDFFHLWSRMPMVLFGDRVLGFTVYGTAVAVFSLRIIPWTSLWIISVSGYSSSRVFVARRNLTFLRVGRRILVQRPCTSLSLSLVYNFVFAPSALLLRLYETFQIRVCILVATVILLFICIVDFFFITIFFVVIVTIFPFNIVFINLLHALSLAVPWRSPLIMYRHW